MKAVGFEEYLPIEAPNAFLDLEMAKPVPEGQDILVAVKAVAINPVETKVRANRGVPAKVENGPRVIGYAQAAWLKLSGQTRRFSK